MQMQNRLVRELTQRNPRAEASAERTLVPEGMLARSSLIGQDICGDKALPEPEGADTNSDTDEPAEAGGDEDQQDVSKSKKKKKRKHTGLQMLQIAVQDKTYLYLTVHVVRIVEPFFKDLLKNREREYKADKDEIRSKSARNRMPWSVYKKIILDRLQKGHG